MDALQRVIDAGLDGMLLSSDIDGRLFFELQVGPFASLDEAEDVRQTLHRAHSLMPSIVVVPAAPEQEELP